MYSEKVPDAIDLSHHLSEVSKARAISPLKGLQKYMTKPGLITMAGGVLVAGILIVRRLTLYDVQALLAPSTFRSLRFLGRL